VCTRRRAYRTLPHAAGNPNAILIDSARIARSFLDYWNLVLADKAKQAAPLRTAAAKVVPKGEAQWRYRDRSGLVFAQHQEHDEASRDRFFFPK